MNYLIYPFKKMAITQRYDETFSHGANYNGSPRDYSIDDNGGTTAKDSYFYCPCDSMTVKKIYGVGTSSTNTVWLESNSKVNAPGFEDYVTILLMHTEDEDLKNIYVGQTFNRGEKVIVEGKDGYATGNHFHMSVGKGKFNNYGWLRNSQGAWVIDSTEGAVSPEDSFYIDKGFTTIVNSRNIVLKELPEAQLIEIGYVIADYLNVRKGPGITYDILETLIRGAKVEVNSQKDGWYEIGDNKWVSSLYISKEKNETSNVGYVMASNLNVRKGAGLTYEVVNMLPEFTKVNILKEENNWCNIGEDQWISKDYIVYNTPTKYYDTKIVTASYLNVRTTPNGNKATIYAPLPKNTIVADLSTSNGWTKIGNNRYVYTYYIK